MVFVYVFQLESLLNVAIKFHYCVRSQCLRSFVCVSGDALFFLLLVVLGSQNSVRLSILLRRTMPFGQSFDTIFPYTHTHTPTSIPFSLLSSPLCDCSFLIKFLTIKVYRTQ